jgi:D-glycero-D-manno-heptose 1,7-bisphosphate phosphatase
MDSLIQKVDKTWSLFLDRDGVINVRIVGDYIKKWDDFKFLPGVLDAVNIFSNYFGRIVVVTNQQGIGKGLMSENDLNHIHTIMSAKIEKAGGRIDKIYHSPYLNEAGHQMRKPDIGMGLEAQKDFNEIDFNKSIMVGDSINDMLFGKRLGMTTVFISDDFMSHKKHSDSIDFVFSSLIDFANNFK